MKRGSKDKVKIEVGARFGRLVILREVEKRISYTKNGYNGKRGLRQVECRCDCGNIVIRDYVTLPKMLKRGSVSSCGCTQRRQPVNLDGVTLDERIVQMKRSDRKEVVRQMIMDGHTNLIITTKTGVTSGFVSAVRSEMGMLLFKITKEIPINQKFNMLTIIGEGERKPTDNTRSKMVLCRCDCGNTINVRLTHVTSGHYISCGCYRTTMSRKMMKEQLVPNNIIHGDSKRGAKYHYLFDIWMCAKQRCYNPNDARYSTYGARGIKFCDEWVENYTAFKEYVLTNLGEKPKSSSKNRGDGYSLDRIDVNKGYEPGNLRWSDFITQSNNKFIQTTGLTRPIMKNQGKKLPCTKTVRKIYENYYKVEVTKGNHLHHIDWDASNNNPLNIIEVTVREHRWLHRIENMEYKELDHYGVREVLNKVDWVEYDKLVKKNRSKKYKEDVQEL